MTLDHTNPFVNFSALLLAVGLMACGGATAPDSDEGEQEPGSTSAALVVRLADSPAISGLSVRADGRPVNERAGGFQVRSGSQLTFYAGNIELATVPAKATVTLFDLVPDHHCESSPELAKVASVLLALDTSVDDGIQLPPASIFQPTVKLANLSEAQLMAAEAKFPAHRSVPLADALLELNRLLDGEAWAENLEARETWTNEFDELSTYLDRVIAALAQGGQNAPTAFGSATLNEVFACTTAFRTQGLVYDAGHAIFSSRYGLQITDNDYLPLKTVPWAVPLDIFQAQVAGASNPFNPDFSVNTSHDFDGLSHIGDIDLYGGKIYAPIEDENVDPSQNAFIALFDAATLNYTGEKHKLPTDKSSAGVPWVAVDGPRGLIYTADWDPIPVLHAWDLKSFAFVKDVPLVWPVDVNTGALTTVRRIQGAKLYHGMLYASADTKETADANLNTKTKRIWKIDPVTGFVAQVFSYEMPNRSESEGLAMSDRPDGQMHVIVLGPYDAAYSDAGYELSGDDWNANSTLRHYTRTSESLRDQLCAE